MTTRDMLLCSGGATSSASPTGQVSYTSAGTYNWVCPANVFSVCVVCVGSGGKGGSTKGGGGGALSWVNDIPVTPSNSYTVFVPASTEYYNEGVPATFNTNVVSAGSGNGGSVNYSASDPKSGLGGVVLVGSGGNGATTTTSSGGGAGGYTGNGNSGTGGSASSGAAGGWGAGGVGILGQGSSGSTTPSTVGLGGSGGGDGFGGYNGGSYGGGAGASGQGGSGAVRIIWGTGRAFPSTNTGDM